MKWKRPIAKVLHRWRTTDRLLALDDLCKSNSYLTKVGWFESVFRRESVDGQHQPIPWLTYPALAFIAGRIRGDMSVFEYGSGNSTRWWGSRVARVVSCEHDESWFNKMSGQLPQNVEYVFAELDKGYDQVILKHASEFDVVVIDGRNRVECARNSVAALKSDGVIIWDNVERERYQPGVRLLHEAGFRQLDFWGMIAIEAVTSCTAVFYREKNCFGI